MHGSKTQAPAIHDTGLTLRQYYIMVSLGAFVTTIAQPGVIGRLPLRLLLKNHLHLNAETVAAFMLISTFAWNVKPIAGILSDAFPLFGTRRRHYMLIGAALSAFCWFLMGVVPKSYWPLIAAAFGANAFMVISSTVMGGLMVEAGQKYGVSGKVTSIRQGVQSAVSLGNGVLGGYLASIAFGWTAGVATGLLLSLAIATYFVLKERRTSTRNREVLHDAGRQLVVMAKSKTLWAAAIFLALVYISPGFATPLLYMQTDKLKFSTQYIGLMETIEGAAGLAGAAVYIYLCRRFNLLQLLTSVIILNAAGTLLFLIYGHSTAPAIHAISGLVVSCSEVALMDLAVRATPPGCESLGFALMMSARNFALGGSDVIGSWLMDSRHWQFHELVWLNSGTTALVLVFLPLLPRRIMRKKEGESLNAPVASGASTAPATTQ